jgi:N,N'-diacetyllegionaminate synthase
MFTMGTIKIKNKEIGEGSPCFIIAEAGVNHNGDVSLAKKLIDTAKDSGADAIKFQTFSAKELASDFADLAEYQKNNVPSFGNQAEMLKKLELSSEEFEELFAYCQEKELIFLSSPFDVKSADFLEELGVLAFKVPSGEITNPLLLRHIARKSKPILLSTGMSSLPEIARALEWINSEVNNQVVLLHCTTSYPAPSDTLNLRALDTLRKEFGLLVGFSDHSEGIVADIAAVSLGACVLEKHFTLDKTMDGPDHKASLEPGELRNMIYSIREAEKMLGTGIKEPAGVEEELVKKIRRGIFASRDILKGHAISAQDINVKRPVLGVPAEDADKLMGRKAKKDIKKGSPISWEEV